MRGWEREDVIRCMRCTDEGSGMGECDKIHAMRGCKTKKPCGERRNLKSRYLHEQRDVHGVAESG